MKAVLLKKHCWDIQARLPYDASQPEKTAAAVAEMMLRVEDHLIPIIDEATDARRAWCALQEVFMAHSATRRAALKTELSKMQKENTETMSQYVDRGQKLRTELVAAGLTVAQFEVVEALILGLPKTFEISKTVLMNQDTTVMSLPWLRNKLTAIETHEDAEEAVALAAAAKKKFKGKHAKFGKEKECYYCHKMGHIAANCRERLQAESEATYVFGRPGRRAAGSMAN